MGILRDEKRPRVFDEHSLCRCCGKVCNGLRFKKMLSRGESGERHEKIETGAKILREAVRISNAEKVKFLLLECLPQLSHRLFKLADVLGRILFGTCACGT